MSNNLKSISIVLLLLLSINLCQSQNSDKTKDTLYVYFKNSKKETKTLNKLMSPPDIMISSYYYNFKKPIHYYRFEYLTHDYINGKAEAKKVLYTIKTKREFFKKNKGNILKFCALKKLSLSEIEKFYWENKNKTVYLIDKEETKSGKIFLRKVTFYSSYLPEQ